MTTNKLKRLFRGTPHRQSRPARAAAVSAMVEAMEGRVLMSASALSTGLSGLSSGGDRPTESLSLNFTKIEYKYVGG
jgi:hypothetical protein